MKLRFLAISDTHLGEDTSVLCFPHGRRRLWTALHELFGDCPEVDDLILLGDVPDRTLSSTSQIITQTNAFMQTLASALEIRRIVYLPGNHDHTIWTDYAHARHGQGVASTAVTGEAIVEAGKVNPEAQEAATPLLSLFLGWPDGSLWRAVEGKPFDFAVANPIYAKAFGQRSYVFTHGTHFRKDVATPSWVKKVLDYLEVDEILGGIEIEPGDDASKATDLTDLERRVAPFVDTLWPSSRSNPTSRSDQLWYLLTYISGKLGHTRAAPAASRKYTWDELVALPSEDRIKRLTPEGAAADGSIALCEQYFLRHALSAANLSGLALDRVTFVYGDTHDGGFGRMSSPVPGGEVRVYNTGGWVVHSEAHHPPCHLFAVDDQGKEYLADITFDGVAIDGRSLLELAADDAENKKRATSRVLRALLALMPDPG